MFISAETSEICKICMFYRILFIEREIKIFYDLYNFITSIFSEICDSCRNVVFFHILKKNPENSDVEYVSAIFRLKNKMKTNS